MADNVLAIINTILCVFRYDASIRREDTVQVSERVGAKTSMSKDGRTSITVSENKDSPTKCKVSILDSKRKHFDSVDLSKRKTFIPETKKAIRSFGGSRVVLAASDPSDNQEGGGSQGIIVFTLWYIFIAYCYARDALGEEGTQTEIGQDADVDARLEDLAADIAEVAHDVAEELAAEPEADVEPPPPADVPDE